VENEIIPFCHSSEREREGKASSIIMNVTQCNLARLMHIFAKGREMKREEQVERDLVQLQVNSISRSFEDPPRMLFFMHAEKKTFFLEHNRSFRMNGVEHVNAPQTAIFPPLSTTPSIYARTNDAAADAANVLVVFTQFSSLPVRCHGENLQFSQHPRE
jgi:hypothetical protein